MSYFGALTRTRTGFGDASAPTPEDVMSFANAPTSTVPSMQDVTGAAQGAAQGYVQGAVQTVMPTIQQAATQGQQLYATANQYAAMGTNATKGDLASVTTLATLISNNIPPQQAQAINAKAIADARAVIGTTAGLATAAVSVLALGGFIAAGTAVLAVPVIGAVAAALIAAAAFILGNMASSPVDPVPPIITAILNVPVPSAATQSVALTPNEPKLLDPTIVIQNCSPYTESGDTVGTTLRSWHDFLAFASGQSDNITSSNNKQSGGYLENWCPGNNCTAENWQTAANQIAQCFAFNMEGQDKANAAIALATRWVPFSDGNNAPYQDVFSGMGAGANGTGATLEYNLIALAYALSSWPVPAADQIALQYLTALAWVWDNFPGNTLPMPAWITYKLGLLHHLISNESTHIVPAVTPPSTVGKTVATIAAASVGGTAAGVAIYAYATRQSFLAVAGQLAGKIGLKRFF